MELIFSSSLKNIKKFAPLINNKSKKDCAGYYGGVFRPQSNIVQDITEVYLDPNQTFTMATSAKIVKHLCIPQVEHLECLHLTKHSHNGEIIPVSHKKHEITLSETASLIAT